MGKLTGKRLAEKYGDFLYPVAKVIADGREMPGEGVCCLESAEVISSVGKEPDMAVLIYRVDKFPAENLAELEGYLQVGQKMEIKAGYGEKTERIFLGYLHETEVCDLMRDYVEYTLICLDVKGLMKKNSVFQVSGAKKAQQILDEIVSDSGYGFLVEKKSVSALPGSMNQDCVVRGNTHYDWMCSLAEYLDYEFFCGQGELIFRKSGEGAGDTVELTAEYGLQAVQATASAAGQTGSVSVYSYNRKDEKIVGSAGWGSSGSPFTGKLPGMLKGLSVKRWDMELETGEQASALARAAMERAKARCFRREAVTIGIPELVPGIRVTITDENVASLSGALYAEEVCHYLDGRGYRSVVRGKGE